MVLLEQNLPKLVPYPDRLLEGIDCGDSSEAGVVQLLWC